jgi:hypothetical protein
MQLELIDCERANKFEYVHLCKIYTKKVLFIPRRLFQLFL